MAPSPSPSKPTTEAPVAVNAPASLEAQVVELRQRVSILEAAALARTTAAPAQAPVGKLAKKELPEEFKGTKTYIVGSKKHYRDGRVYEAGEKITVTNERPASDWVPFDPTAVAKAPVAAPTSGKRAADSDAA